MTQKTKTPQKGFEYEKNVCAVLKSFNVVPEDFEPARRQFKAS